MNNFWIGIYGAVNELKVADPFYNKKKIEKMISSVEDLGGGIVAFPELSLSSYTAYDLFCQDDFYRACQEGILDIREGSKDQKSLIIVGSPFKYMNNLYDASFVIYKGEILSIVTKKKLLANELKVFSKGPEEGFYLDRGPFSGAYFGNDLIFKAEDLFFSVKLGEDFIENPSPLIINPASERELLGSMRKTREGLLSFSSYYGSGILRISPGYLESTTDSVFSGQAILVEDGKILAENDGDFGLIYEDLDLDIINKRSFDPGLDELIELSGLPFKGESDRTYPKFPYLSQDEEEREEELETAYSIQIKALKKRLKHIKSDKLVLGLSGGLDSSLALLSAVKCMDSMGVDRKNILALSMPGPGTGKRTKNNAQILAEILGVTFKEISISKAVQVHFQDIGLDENDRSVSYENAQARERTQILMDIANKTGAIVLGTGDLSELALGWCTYNGDQMSMYAINSGIPKTLIREMLSYEMRRSENKDLREVLLDILETPISPELLPQEEGTYQDTEDLIGPYEIHDFLIYYSYKYHMRAEKIFLMVRSAFPNYSDEKILSYMEIFYRRSLSQRFKSSCMVDGPQVTDVSLSPRTSLNLVSDVSPDIFTAKIKDLRDKYL